jgi:hypothetical protein
MDRRFSNATSSLASAALKFCIELANYWHAIRELVSRLCRSGWRLESWHCSSGSREGLPRTTPS